MKPTVGRTVWYYPHKDEQKVLNNNQTTAPAIITAVWSESCINLKILYDGQHNVWKTSVTKFDTNLAIPGANPEGMWAWPVIVE